MIFDSLNTKRFAIMLVPAILVEVVSDFTPMAAKIISVVSFPILHLIFRQLTVFLLRLALIAKVKTTSIQRPSSLGRVFLGQSNFQVDRNPNTYRDHLSRFSVPSANGNITTEHFNCTICGVTQTL